MTENREVSGIKLARANLVGNVVSYVGSRKLTIGKFLVVSGSAVLLNLLLLFLMVTYLGFGTPLKENLANALSMELSIIYNFVTSRAITWSDRRKEKGGTLFIQIVKFHLAIGVTILLRLALFAVLQRFGVFYLYNALIGIGLAAVFNFVVYDTLIFKKGEMGDV